MAKKIVQDVLPPDRRSIRNIPLPENKTKRKTAAPKVFKESPPKKRESKRNYTRIGIWGIAVLCVLGLLYALSFFFVGATITATPKEEDVTVDLTVDAEPTAEEGIPSYTIITISKDGEKEIQALGEEKIEKKATGKIVIYNNFSSAPQTLVKETRFETPDGLIFRITSAVTVPGRVTKNSVITPGSVKATVVADKPGEKYNVGLADFTIPGFKGDPRYKGFSAKTDPAEKIGGGFVGVVRKVSEKEEMAARALIESSLRSDLILLARAQIPSTHVLYYDAVEYSFEKLAQGSPAGTSTAMIREKGTLYGVLLNRDELTEFLAGKILEDKSGAKQVRAKNLEELGATFKNKTSFDYKGMDKATFELKGELALEWDINSKNAEGNTLQERLAGRKRSEIKDILSEFTSIEKAEIVVRPFWSLSFPKNPDNIRVKVLSP